jgi:hypothetical protein
MLSLRDVTLAAAAARDLPDKALTPRQGALLEGAGRSVCGVFVVRQRRGPMTLLQDIDSGVRYEIREHNMEAEYGEGSAVTGRLIPIREIGWIRSPGSIISSQASDQTLSFLTRALRRRRDNYRSIVIEMLNAVLRGEKPRRFVQPAPSREMAAETSNDFAELMLTEGLGRQDTAASAPGREAVSELGAPDLASNFDAVDIEVDEVIKGWLLALREQAEFTPNRWGVDHDAAQRRHGKRTRS